MRQRCQTPDLSREDYLNNLSSELSALARDTANLEEAICDLVFNRLELSDTDPTNPPQLHEVQELDRVRQSLVDLALFCAELGHAEGERPAVDELMQQFNLRDLFFRLTGVAPRAADAEPNRISGKLSLF